MRDEGKAGSERVDLRVRTKQFALRVIRLFWALPRGPVADVIGKQLLRSGTSVGANFREAHRARSDAEFVCKVGDCMKELEETCYWFKLLIDAELVGRPSRWPTSWVIPPAWARRRLWSQSSISTAEM
jgi:four helix bundle protein